MDSQACLLAWFHGLSMSSVKSSPNLTSPIQTCAAKQHCQCHLGRVRRHRHGLRVLVPSIALMKRLKKIGLTIAYRNEKNTQEVSRCLLALPLTPAADIALAFKDVTATRLQRTHRCGAIVSPRPQTVAYSNCQYETILLNTCSGQQRRAKKTLHDSIAAWPFFAPRKELTSSTFRRTRTLYHLYIRVSDKL